ncbi:MAG: ADP/ATP-dependent (S)-NAD(P)H-hydrate dehydratase [Terrimesophilobacter sp.]
MSAVIAWTPDDARHSIAVPGRHDDKYSRGVLGVITGSDEFPGAAVLGVEAALHTGVGMVRYLGPKRSTTLVLQRRPEVVASGGRVQAWLIGSGISATHRGPVTTARAIGALTEGVPVVVDSGCLDLLDSATGPTVITPHYRELARILTADVEEIADDPEYWAARAAEQLGVTVLLKGHNTYVAAEDGTKFVVADASAWLATAGTGDALAGILGALVATHSEQIAADVAALPRLAASAAVLHAAAAQVAGRGGPFTVLDLAGAVSGVIAQWLTA